ncbi:MAG TPA: hypothetical protein VLH84_03055 [Patescibacteria group bacterium]|nr:hypothetical protein [Patescibacteria group bacterium]
MKNKDFALVLVMVGIGAIVALIVSHFTFSSASARKQNGEVVDAISSQFSPPPAKYFNPSATNPAPEIQTGNSSNPNPFNGSSQ